MDHPPDSVSRCRELIAVAVSQIDGDPIIGDRLVDPALEITVAHFKKIIALQRAGRRNPITHENAEDLTANILVGRSVTHRSTIGFARHRSYGRTATLNIIVARPTAFLTKQAWPPLLDKLRDSMTLGMWKKRFVGGTATVTAGRKCFATYFRTDKLTNMKALVLCPPTVRRPSSGPVCRLNFFSDE